jgi:NADP-dependent 3-hydroxy acid dehydrogenase YdfG
MARRAVTPRHGLIAGLGAGGADFRLSGRHRSEIDDSYALSRCPSVAERLRGAGCWPREAITALFGVDGKAVVVAGGSRGIGAMIASGLVRAGCRVHIMSRKKEACDSRAAELSAAGECISLPANLTESAGPRQFARELTERVERLHVLVNNAGATWGTPLEQYPLEAFDKLWNINVKALFNITIRCLPPLRAAASAHDPAPVINGGSIDGLRVSVMENYAYGATKAGVHMLYRAARHPAAQRVGHRQRARPRPLREQGAGARAPDPGMRAAIEADIPSGASERRMTWPAARST